MTARAALTCLGMVAGLAATTHAHGYGEKIDTYPSVEERQIHLFTDILRVDPMVFWDGEGEYSPKRPLIYNYDLNRAAFAHAFDMHTNGCFQHESCDGTTMEERGSGFYSGYSNIGENIAMGYSSSWDAVFNGWLYSDGHRANMLHAVWNELGTGYEDDGGSGRWYVQDFGSRGDAEEPYLTSGTHWPEHPGTGDAVTFYTAWYDPAGIAPQRVRLAMDDACHEMELEYGEPEMGVYSVDLEVEQENCPPYVFLATLPSGDEITLPTEGSLVMLAGDAVCDDYRDQRPSSPCGEWGDDLDAGGCEPRACSTGTGEDVISETDVGTTEYGTCAQVRSRPRATPFVVTLAGAGLLLAWRRLVWSRRS